MANLSEKGYLVRVCRHIIGLKVMDFLVVTGLKMLIGRMIIVLRSV